MLQLKETTLDEVKVEDEENEEKGKRISSLTASMNVGGYGYFFSYC